MDTLYASLLSLLIVVLSFSLHFLLFKSTSTTNKTTVLPPGTTGWPVIGESFEYLTTQWKGHPEKFVYSRMSKFSPIVFRTSLLLEDVAVFCGAQGNKFLFSNEGNLVHEWWPITVRKIFSSSSYDHNTMNPKVTIMMRKMLSNFLSPETLRSYVPIMDAVVQRHFATKWDGNKEVLTHELTRHVTFSVACKAFLGIEDPVRVEELVKPIKDICLGLFAIPIDLPWTRFRRGINASDVLKKEFIAIMKQKKKDMAQGKLTNHDILTHMIQFRDDDGNLMEEEDIANKILALLIGGHDTASCTCVFIVKYLSEYPEIYDKVYEEQTEIAKSKAPGELLNWEDLAKMKYSWNVAREVLRLVPPLQGAFREAIADFKYNGYTIPKGWKLYWSTHSTHRNPEIFPKPEKFDPSRFEGNGPAPYTFVPFGGGPHMCPGRDYARQEILIFMHHLVRKFKWETIIPDEPVYISTTPAPAKDLPIRLFPHNNN